MMKILVLSNNALSKQNSNGRTMMNFLGCFPAEDIAQFYIHGQADGCCCKYYYNISDYDVLYTVTHLGKSRKVKDIEKNNVTVSHDKVQRNTRNMVLRDIAWRTNLWWGQDFNSFISSFEPNVVILQAGDCPFMYYIAMKIAKGYRIPLVMYNSEGYVLKKVLYANSSKKDLWHNVLQRRLKNAYRKMMSRVSYCFYATEFLEQEYQKKYPHQGKSMAIYTASDMMSLEDQSELPFRVVYCGNLGVGRVQPLCEVADVLALTDPEATMDIYGQFREENDQEELCARRNVRYFGTVPYAEIPHIMSKANLLLHCEATDRLENLRYAFSTKIADSLASGRPFLVYANRGYPFVQYLQKRNAAHIAGNKEELIIILQNCLKDKAYLNSHTANAVLLASECHSKEKNSSIFYDTINDVCTKGC